MMLQTFLLRKRQLQGSYQTLGLQVLPLGMIWSPHIPLMPQACKLKMHQSPQVAMLMSAHRLEMHQFLQNMKGPVTCILGTLCQT